jgi:hypothetical protein
MAILIYNVKYASKRNLYFLAKDFEDLLTKAKPVGEPDDPCEPKDVIVAFCLIGKLTEKFQYSKEYIHNGEVKYKYPEDSSIDTEKLTRKIP